MSDTQITSGTQHVSMAQSVTTLFGWNSLKLNWNALKSTYNMTPVFLGWTKVGIIERDAMRMIVFTYRDIFVIIIDCQLSHGCFRIFLIASYALPEALKDIVHDANSAIGTWIQWRRQGTCDARPIFSASNIFIFLIFYVVGFSWKDCPSYVVHDCSKCQHFSINKRVRRQLVLWSYYEGRIKINPSDFDSMKISQGRHRQNWKFDKESADLERSLARARSSGRQLDSLLLVHTVAWWRVQVLSKVEMRCVLSPWDAIRSIRCCLVCKGLHMGWYVYTIS